MFVGSLLLAAAFAGSPLVVHDAATVSVNDARKIISEIDAGRPALIVGGPLLSRRNADWNGKSTFPTVEGVWPEYKTYVKDDRVCYLDRLTGEGFGRGNVWRMKRLANAAEAILIERRKGRPERCVALFGYRKAEDLADTGVRARMNWALKAIGEGALLYEAGTDQFSYDPGETVTVGAGGIPQYDAKAYQSKDNNGESYNKGKTPDTATGGSSSVVGGSVDLVALGGGGGGNFNYNNNDQVNSAGLVGGSGGGAGGHNEKAVSGGAGTEGQGFAGANNANPSSGGGGGGGAGEEGSKPDSAKAGNGGDGKVVGITGEQICYGGGGGGGGYAVTYGLGGEGGGGDGNYDKHGPLLSQNGVDGLGGGGGGGGYEAFGGAGGSGVVILRFARLKKGFAVIVR